MEPAGKVLLRYRISQKPKKMSRGELDRKMALKGFTWWTEDFIGHKEDEETPFSKEDYEELLSAGVFEKDSEWDKDFRRALKLDSEPELQEEGIWVRFPKSWVNRTVRFRVELEDERPVIVGMTVGLLLIGLATTMIQFKRSGTVSLAAGLPFTHIGSGVGWPFSVFLLGFILILTISWIVRIEGRYQHKLGVLSAIIVVIGSSFQIYGIACVVLPILNYMSILFIHWQWLQGPIYDVSFDIPGIVIGFSGCLVLILAAQGVLVLGHRHGMRI
jgi:hypothetical protein